MGAGNYTRRITRADWGRVGAVVIDDTGFIHEETADACAIDNAGAGVNKRLRFSIESGNTYSAHALRCKKVTTLGRAAAITRRADDGVD